MKQVLVAVCLGLLFGSYASAQSKTDSILTTKGAVTLITCGSAINTFQIGDGKNADYDYRIVDGNVVFIRPIVANPKPTNLVVREGDNIHYMILAFRDKADLSSLKYTLSTGNGNLPPANIQSGGNAGGAPRLPGNTSVPVEEPAPVTMAVDTVTVSRIADDFMKQKKGNRQIETTTEEGISVNFGQAMVLNNLIYCCYHLRNRSAAPFNISKIVMLHKEQRDTATLHGMPVVYRKGQESVAAKDEQAVVYVVPAAEFKKDDEIILMVYNKADNKPVVLYTPASALPKYMITK